MVFYKKFLMVAVLGVSLTQVVIAMEAPLEDGASSGGGAKQKEVTFASSSGGSDVLPIVEEEEKDQGRKEYVAATMGGIHGAAVFLDGYVPASCQSSVKGAAAMLLTVLSTKPGQDAVELVGRTGKTVLDSSYVQAGIERANPYVQAAIVKGKPKAEEALKFAGPLARQVYDEAESLCGRWTKRSSTVHFAVSETTNVMWLGIAWVRSFCQGKQKSA